MNKFALALCALIASTSALVAETSDWDMVPQILHRIVPPSFPHKDFVITDYGALGNGTADCSAAFASAIDACVQAGGGHVVVPPGEYLTGPIHLKSNVDLHVEKGATLKFSTNPDAYLPAVFTRFEGIECYNYSALIYVYEQTNVAITGEGTLDGQADDTTWLAWKGRRGGSNNQKDRKSVV